MIDVLKKFTNNEGKFKDELKSVVQGLLSLYEGAHFLVHGETILDKAPLLNSRRSRPYLLI